MGCGNRIATVTLVVVVVLSTGVGGAAESPSAGAVDAPVTTESGLSERVGASAVPSSGADEPSNRLQWGGRTADTAGEIRLAFELFRTPERPGEIRVRLTATVPDDVTALTVRVAPSASATSLDGFASTSEDGAFDWDGETTEPTITYRLPVNRTGDASAAGRFDAARFDASLRTETPHNDSERITVVSGAASRSVGVSEARPTRVGSASTRSPDDSLRRGIASRVASQRPPRAQESGLLYADPGPWALVQLPRWRVSYTFRGSEPTVRATHETAGEGAIGGRTAFLGPHETITRTAAGQTFRLIVPAAARPTAAPRRVLDVLANASDALRVGDRDETLFAVVAPTTVAWGPAGLANGDSDFWVRADERLRTADNVWLHEYVHTRQAYRTTDNARWLLEGTADYYAAKLAVRFELIGYEAFADQLDRGRGDPDATLTDPTTWEPRTPYTVGALVAGHLDRRIALATNGSATFQTVLRRFDDRAEPVSQTTIASVVRETANASVAREADRYTTTTDRPPVWTANAHDAAFGTLPARIETRIVGYEVTGPYRETTSDAPPAAVVPSETLAVRVIVANEGASSGAYSLQLAADGRTVAAAEGSLDPGESRLVPLTYTVSEADNATVTLNGEPLDVRVREPAVAEVTAVTVESDRVRPGERVAVLVTLANPTDRPAERTIAVALDGERVAAPTVRLAPGAERTVTVPVSAETTGERTISVGDRSVTVLVATPTATESSATGTATTDETDTPSSGTAAERVTSTATPGFGAGLAALAVLALVVALVGWRRS